jgi:hypothetical protein
MRNTQNIYRAKRLADQLRKVNCIDFECPQYLNGWISILSPTQIEPKTGELAVNILRTECKKTKRYYTEEQIDENLIKFHFEAGQPCFKSGTHIITIEKVPLLYRNGKSISEPNRWTDYFNEDTYQFRHQNK